MPKQIKNRPVSFNINDPYQRKLYEHTLQYSNYSAYIKSLIQRDMEGGHISNEQQTDDVEDGGVNIDMLHGLI
ncbi:Uncharacterised protein [Niallia circulans]|uniref:hypothetical protein n=1 Tax=Niallia circulans TaxID=1397 RepID=UPI00077CB6E1|nr:hypothetical protein [Niallia circulans]MDR4318661.1 hypothetical protein [Niallia circulans]MED3839378.1 hypothetical protein [Niallia circulans]MED4245361.1 hypothetical protein [Niallia circulans]MED4250896.1 hypothetical protein [Niallia circulans]QKH60174.1 hypothetical protein FOC77_05660 [Niallia circulans]